MRKYASCLIAPAAVLCIMLPVFSFYGLYPFGDYTIAWCDMNQQVIPFLMDFKDILSGKGNLFFNLQNAGGMSFWGVFLFFISSPFSFLVAFVSKQEIYHLVNLFVVIKMMVCGLTASVFLKRQFHHMNFLQNLSLSLMYGFSGYAMFYYQNQVWLDVMYLFPVLLIGLIMLLREDRVTLYVISLSAILYVNFYLSYMVCIFIVLSFGLYIALCAPKELRGKSTVLLGCSTLMVMMITAVVWLPSLLQYLGSARTGNLLANILAGRFFTQWETTLSLLLCSGVLLAVIVLHLRKRHQKIREENFVFFVLILMLIPTVIDPLNKMWHTGSYQAFPVRYGYIPIFFAIIYYAMYLDQTNGGYLNLNKTLFPKLHLLFAIFGVAAVLALAINLIDKDYKALTVYTRTLWSNKRSFFLILIFALAVGFVYYMTARLTRYGSTARKVGSVLLCCAVVIECVFNTTVYMVSPANKAENHAAVTDLSDKISDESFYRVKTDSKYFDVNLVGGIGYPSLNHYSSLTNQDYLFFMKKMGYSSYWMEVSSNGGTEFSDAILGNRYSIINDDETEKTDTVVYRNGQYAIRKNPFSMPVGIVMSGTDIQSMKNLPQTTRAGTQQFVFQSVFRTVDTLFHNYEPKSLGNVSYTEDDRTSVSLMDHGTKGELIYSIPVTEAETLYFDCFDKLSNNLIEGVNGSTNVSVNGKLIQANYPSQRNNALLKLGSFAHETVTVRVEILKDISVRSFGVFGLRQSVLQKAVESANTAQLQQKGNQIVGTAVASDGNDYLFIPICYEKSGYSVRVNGKASGTVRMFDSMLAVKLEKGENQITIEYTPPGFKMGAGVTAVGCLLLICFLIFLKKNLYSKLRFLEFPAQIAFSILFAGVFFLIYIFPILAYFII